MHPLCPPRLSRPPPGGSQERCCASLLASAAALPVAPKEIIFAHVRKTVNVMIPILATAEHQAINALTSFLVTKLLSFLTQRLRRIRRRCRRQAPPSPATVLVVAFLISHQHGPVSSVAAYVLVIRAAASGLVLIQIITQAASLRLVFSFPRE